MRTSPVQLIHLTFERVCVEVDRRHFPAAAAEGKALPTSLLGVALNTVVEFARLNGATESSSTELFRVSIELKVDNETAAGDEPSKYSPYLVKMLAVGIVEIPHAASELAPIEDLALVNGASLVWSSMREQLATVTGRMPLGSVQLPSVHFQDLRSDAPKKVKQLPDAPATASKKMRATKTAATK
ncbi:hypothetical protein [Hydrogenophaga sp.]|uniref:hypothetical protein n=1 Tax=Hydrogenophaga sp. TaxID=1904254 RepID=UPI003AF60347